MTTEKPVEAEKAKKQPAAQPASQATAAAPKKKGMRHRSAIKAARQARRRHLRNKSVESEVKTFIKKVDLLIEDNDLAKAEAELRTAMSALDRAAKKGVIHRNNAARRKSRLVARLDAVRMAKATAAAPKTRRRTTRKTPIKTS